MPRKCIFLDRDGTLNVDINYLHRIADWQWMPGAVEAIRAFNAAGYAVVVVTNQSGIGRGYYTAAQVEQLHREVDGLLAAEGARIDAYYYCPDLPDAATDCRKPAPGMLLRAAGELDLDLARSWMVGNKLSDVEAGIAAGTRAVLMTEDDRALAAPVDPRYAHVADMDSVCRHILAADGVTPV